MKRLITVLLLLFSCVILSATAAAAESTYYLEELGMSIGLPDDYIALTRDMDADDPSLREYGLDWDALSAMFLEKSIYLNAWNSDMDYEIVVTMVDSQLGDYNLYSDTTLSAFASAFEPDYENAGIIILRHEIYQHSQARFVKLYIYQQNDGQEIYGLQYHTVYAGKTINITMQSYSGGIDAEKEAIQQQIVDTAHFDAEPQTRQLPDPTEAFTYTDTVGGVSFTVPANWVEEPVEDSDGSNNAVFVSNLEEGLTIGFVSQDLMSEEFWEESGMSWLDRMFVTRSDINNSVMTKADVAESYGVSESAVSMVSLGNKEYFMLESIETGTAYGLHLKVPMTTIVRCENGYMYIFRFGAAKDSAYFADFEELVRSAEYFIPETDDTVEDRPLMIWLLLTFVILAAICVLVVFLIRKASANRKQEENTAREAAASFGADANEIFFCHRCGSRLPADGTFCSKCGTQIPIARER